MTKIYKKYFWTVLLTILFVWSVLAPSHFQKGGVGIDFLFYITLFITIISLLLCLRFDSYRWIEKILVSLLIAFISLFFTTLIICPIIVELFYGDKTWFLWESNHRFLINSMYYGLNTAILTILSKGYFNLRGHLKS